MSSAIDDITGSRQRRSARKAARRQEQMLQKQKQKQKLDLAEAEGELATKQAIALDPGKGRQSLLNPNRRRQQLG